jgi:hypothetical protein
MIGEKYSALDSGLYNRFIGLFLRFLIQYWIKAVGIQLFPVATVKIGIDSGII